MAEFDVDIAQARAGVSMEAVQIPGSYLLLLEPTFEKLEQCREILKTVQLALQNVDGSMYEIVVLTNTQEILTEGDYAAKLEQELADIRETIRRQVAPRWAHPGDKK
jgi:type II secretory pathway component PulM